VRSKEDERQSVSKTVLTDFEKPVILRPRSTTDLPRPRNEFAQQENVQRQAQVSPELKLRVKQDLEARVQIDGIKDDTEFESYFNDLQEELEIATGEKYTFSKTSIALTVEHTSPSFKPDYIHAIPSSHRHQRFYSL
jgi:hypothetical protein